MQQKLIIRIKTFMFKVRFHNPCFVIGTRKHYIALDRLGIEFRYHGDNVILLWPWKRTTYKYISLNCEGGFPTLKAIDEFWNQYNEYLKQEEHKNG